MLQPLATELHSARLTLHGHRREDFEDSFALWNDETVMRFIAGKPSAREESWQRLLRYAGLWVLLGYGYWVIRETASGRFVGEVGFADFKRGLDPAFDGVPEIGWVLMESFRGQGYATEAAQTALDWIERQRGLSRSICLIGPGNVPSVRIAQKCGYRQWGRIDLKGKPAVIFER